MKTKYFIGILSALLLAGLPVKAQYAANGYRTGTVISNYSDDYDYYYSSRINRFHRDFVTFDYYAPVYTETYWYSYQPDTWGLSIYRGGLGFSTGYNFYYPLYTGFDYYYDYGWYDPFFNNSYYWGYQPYYSTIWYTPVIINIGLRNRWDNHYRGWDRNYFWNGYYRGNEYRPVYNTYNNYYNSSSTRYSTRNNNQVVNTDNRNQSRRQESTSTRSQNTTTRRDTPSTNTRVTRTRPENNTNTGTRSRETGRNSNSTVNNRQTDRTNNSNPANNGRAAENTRRTGEVRNNTGNRNVNKRTSDSEAGQVRSERKATVTPPVNTSSGRRESTMRQSRTKTSTETTAPTSGSSDSKKGRRK